MTTTTTSDTTTINHFINGAETAGEGSRTQPVYNPATGAVTGELRLANRADLDTTVAAARAAADSWGDISLAKRTAVLFKFRELVASHIDELAELITAEHGKVLSDAKGEIGRGLEVIEFACGIPQLLKGDYSDQVSTGIDVFSFREPLGSTSRSWCRCGWHRWLSPPATPSSSSPPSATPPPRCCWPGCGSPRACPMACSRSCTVTRKPSMDC
jgi:hypothetical protein